MNASFKSISTDAEGVFKRSVAEILSLLEEQGQAHGALLHRNGKGKCGTERNIAKKDVRNLAQLVQNLVEHIEQECRKVAPAR